MACRGVRRRRRCGTEGAVCVGVQLCPLPPLPPLPLRPGPAARVSFPHRRGQPSAPRAVRRARKPVPQVGRLNRREGSVNSAVPPSCSCVYPRRVLEISCASLRSFGPVNSSAAAIAGGRLSAVLEEAAAWAGLHGPAGAARLARNDSGWGRHHAPSPGNGWQSRTRPVTAGVWAMPGTPPS